MEQVSSVLVISKVKCNSYIETRCVSSNEALPTFSRSACQRSKADSKESTFASLSICIAAEIQPFHVVHKKPSPINLQQHVCDVKTPYVHMVVACNLPTVLLLLTRLTDWLPRLSL